MTDYIGAADDFVAMAIAPFRELRVYSPHRPPPQKVGVAMAIAPFRELRDTRETVSNILYLLS